MPCIKNYLKKILYPSLVWIAGFLALPFPAHAIFFLGPLAVAAIVYAALFILQYIGGMLFSFGGFLAGYFINFNLALTNNPLTATGWTIVRDVANLGFVLVIIVIAFATIIRYKTYGAQKLLPKLIAAAIIVNFSLTIGNVFINFSHILTRYFFSQVTASQSLGGGAIVDALSAAFNPQNLFIESAEPSPIDPEDEVGAFSQLTAGFLNQIVSVFFVVIFTFAGAFVLFIFAFMLLVRYIYLSILLIISPLVWLFWVIPALEGMFKQWWSKFLEWLFFAPAVSFFFYLTLLSVQKIGTGVAALKPEQYFKDDVIASVIAQGAKMTVLIGLLIGGMIIAQKFGISGAAFAMKTMQGAAAGAGAGLRKYAGNRATRTLDLISGGRAGKWVREKTKEAGEGPAGKAWKWAMRPTLAGVGKEPTGWKGVFGTEAETKRISLVKSVLGGMKEGSGLFTPKKEKPEKPSRAELRKNAKKLREEVKRRGGPEKAREQYEEAAEIEGELQKRIRLDVQLGMKWETNEIVEAIKNNKPEDQTKINQYINAGFDPNAKGGKGKLLNEKIAYKVYSKRQEEESTKAKTDDEKLEYEDNISAAGDLITKVEEEISKIEKREKEKGGGT